MNSLAYIDVQVVEPSPLRYGDLNCRPDNPDYFPERCREFGNGRRSSL
jgi:hypothetical protein